MNKVLDERDEGDLDAATQQPANDALTGPEPKAWNRSRKTVAASE